MEAARLAVVFSGDTRQADKAFGHMDRKVSGFGKITQKVSSLQAVAMGVVGAGVLKVAGDFVTAASDVGEQTNVVQQRFEGASGAVLEFAENSKSIGIAKAQSMEAAAGFGGMFEAAKLASDESAQMSIRMVRLAGDMASFMNQDPSEMLDKLRSGLAGEAEPLRRFGVFLSENEVKLRAYKDGIAETGSELTEAQKIQARYNLILEQTSKAHGDFERTLGESLPNQLRVMRAEWTDLSAEIGEKALPQLISAVKGMRMMLPVVGELLSRIPQLVTAFAAFKLMQFLPALLVNVGAGMENIGGAAGRMGTRVGTAGIALRGLAGPLSIVAAGTVVAWTETQRMREEMEAMVTLIEGDLTDALIRASSGGREWEDSLDAALREMGVANKDLPEFHEKLGIAASISGEFGDAMGEAERRTKQVSAEGARWSGLARELTGSTRGAATAFGEQEEAAKGSAAALREQRDAARELRNAQLELAGGFLSVQGAAFSLEDAQLGLAEAQAKVTKLEERGRKGTKAYAEAVRELERQQLATMESQLGLVESVASYVSEQDDSVAAGKEAVKMIRDYGKDAGLTKGEINDLIKEVKGLIKEYDKLPPEKNTDITADTRQANAALDAWMRKVNATKVGVEVVTQGFGQRRHEGGLIFGSGDIPAVLEGGEFVIRKEAAKMLGPDILEKLNRVTTMAAIRNEYHTGGPVPDVMSHAHGMYDFAAVAAETRKLVEQMKAAAQAGGDATPAIRQVYAATMAAFPDIINFGIKNIRPIAGTSTWSQHAYGNAWDASRAGWPGSLDPVNAWLRSSGLPISQLIFRQFAGGSPHLDHIHISGDPLYGGDPYSGGHPLDKGGVATVRGPAMVTARVGPVTEDIAFLPRGQGKSERTTTINLVLDGKQISRVVIDELGREVSRR